MSRTITALSTAPGTAGIAIVRLSGPEAVMIASRCFKGKEDISKFDSHTIHRGKFYSDGKQTDDIMLALFRGPNSYTGEDLLEFYCHGGMILADEIINALIQAGASAADPGEFTRRAFINGKMDLTQVEAVADLIHSTSIAGVQTAARQLEGGFTHKLSLLRKELIDIASLLEIETDFADEDLIFADKTQIKNKISDTALFCTELSNSYKAAQILRSGYFVAIAGAPNSGKSTLFNSLLERKRAIVSDIPGTTRDYLEESIYIDRINIIITDTAGIRESEDFIEIEGIKLMETRLAQANMILVINDISIGADNTNILYFHIKEKYPESIVMLVQNKIDKSDNLTYSDNIPKTDQIPLSAITGYGLDALKQTISKNASSSTERIQDVLINQRQSTLLRLASDCLNTALASLESGFENEIIAIDIRQSASQLGELTGEQWSNEVLNNIFGNFCIGK